MDICTLESTGVLCMDQVVERRRRRRVDFGFVLGDARIAEVGPL